MGISRLLSSGVDVWLNTPVHPFEASGTSGMKAAINGTVNLSVLDGWWAEAYDGRREPRTVGASRRRSTSRARRSRPSGRDDALRDPAGRSDPAVLRARREARLLARMGRALQALDGLDAAARSTASACCATTGSASTRRASRQGRAMAAGEFAIARELAAWKAKVRAAWPGVELKRSGAAPTQARFGDTVRLEVDVVLNGLAPSDVRVECVVRRALGSELDVPVPAMPTTRRAQHGVNYVDDEGVPARAVRARRGRATRPCAVTGSRSSRPGRALCNTRSVPCRSIRIWRIRTSSA